MLLQLFTYNVIIFTINDVSIPQAVSAVATKSSNLSGVFNPAVSIPQAVSAVATAVSSFEEIQKKDSFNTASGKCCCNLALSWPTN